MLNVIYPGMGYLDQLTASVIIGVVVTLAGIAVIGIAGNMKAQSLSEEEKKAAVKDFNFPKGIVIALLAGFMSGCFNVGLSFGENVSFAESSDMFKTLPATFLVTLGGFVTNAIYCFYQNTRNKTWCDYGKTAVWGNNLMFCLLAGALWYSQFFGLSLGKGFLTDSPVLTTFSFCILMALNVVFSNVWGIILEGMERLLDSHNRRAHRRNSDTHNILVPPATDLNTLKRDGHVPSLTFNHTTQKNEIIS